MKRSVEIEGSVSGQRVFSFQEAKACIGIFRNIDCPTEYIYCGCTNAQGSYVIGFYEGEPFPVNDTNGWAAYRWVKLHPSETFVLRLSN